MLQAEGRPSIVTSVPTGQDSCLLVFCQRPISIPFLLMRISRMLQLFGSFRSRDRQLVPTSGWDVSENPQDIPEDMFVSSLMEHSSSSSTMIKVAKQHHLGQRQLYIRINVPAQRRDHGTCSLFSRPGHSSCTSWVSTFCTFVRKVLNST